MAKKQFKAESKRLLDMMINSIYTHKEIFLRELISNASDALDKLAYRSLTDPGVGMNREDFKIEIQADPEARTLTIRDNGIGMNKEELENNLGTIAKSGSFQFKKDLAEDTDRPDIIGQFGVGFYSAFMVAERVTVESRTCGEDTAWRWESSGADGYTVTECDKAQVGTEIVMYLKPDTEEENYSEYLESDRIVELIKRYSDYIRWPIRTQVTRSRRKQTPNEQGQIEWEDYTQEETVNSMIPLWQRSKSEVTAEEQELFYCEKFGDSQGPRCTVWVNAEGAVSYRALLFVPSEIPYNYYSREYEKGLQLYSSGVLIMDKCAELLPEHFRFVRGVVDTQDISLNISREMLQQTRGLQIIAGNLEKKIKAELMKLQKDDRKAYEEFWKQFGVQIKYGMVSDMGEHCELLQDLLLFHSSRGEQVTLGEYLGAMKEEQKYIYYATGEELSKIVSLPQAERVLDKGYEILYLTDEVDEFVLRGLRQMGEKYFKSINDEDAVPETDEEREHREQQAAENQALMDFLKETLGEDIKSARLSRKLKSHAVCMTAEGGLSLEMEKYLRKMDPEKAKELSVGRILELNPEHPAFLALQKAFGEDREKAERYAKVLYYQALLIADLPLENPAEYSDLICSLLN